MARLITVHLLVADQTTTEPQSSCDIAASIADGVSALLGDAEASGFLLDWGYARGGMPEDSRAVIEDGYEEGDFYERLAVPLPQSAPLPQTSAESSSYIDGEG